MPNKPASGQVETEIFPDANRARAFSSARTVFDWALSPERTDEEAYFAERVVEWGTELWRSKQKLSRSRSWDEEH